MFKKIVFFIILCGLILSPYSFGLLAIKFIKAGTTIDFDEITEDTAWTKENGPYLVLDNLFVRSGATLLLEAGTIVKFKFNKNIFVQGRIETSGTPEDMVVFTSINDDAHGGKSVSWSSGDPAPGDWSSVLAQADGTINMANTIIKYGGKQYISLTKREGIFLKSNYAHAQTMEFDVGAVSAQGGQIQINSAKITDNIIGVEGKWGNNSIAINDSEIYDNTYVGIANYGNNQISAVNNWWGDDAGPYHETLNPQGLGDEIKGDVLFDPWIGKSQEPKRNPVIIVPGIMGSVLNNNDPVFSEVWPNIDTMLLPGDDSYLNELILPYSGISDENGVIAPTDIIRQILIKDFFNGLINELEDSGYEENSNFFVFPYDWRLDIGYLAGNSSISSTGTLQHLITKVKTDTDSDKVDIIAHSMGGLIAKKYIYTFGTSSVNQFIDIATPHLGAPKAFKILMYGDSLGFVKRIPGFELGLNPERVKIISQNFPSVYQLLPSQNYFSENDNDYAYYVYDMHDLDNNDIKGRLDYDQSIEFMKNIGRNEYLLGVNNILHSEIDSYSPQQDNVPTFNIIGCGNPTIGQIFVMNKEKSGEYEYGLKYINGDSTVPFRSAKHLIATNTYYSNETEHAYLPGANGIRQLIISILKDAQQDFNFADYESLSQTDNICSFSGTQISFHSPIELHVYDENYNHLGLNNDNDIEMGIEGAQYDIIEDNKFVFLPLGKTYTIIGKATDTGSFNVRIQNINNNQYEQTVYYNEIPIETTKTKVEFTISDEQTEYVMQIDQDGNGDYESEINPSSILNEQESQDLIKPETIINILETRINDNWIAPVKIELAARDNENGSGILKTEYSLDNKETWTEYQEPFTIFALGAATIFYSSTDRAGNREENKTETIIIVEITIDTTIQDIEKAYQDKDITKEWIKNSLIFRLNLLQKYIDKCNDKEICERVIKLRYNAILLSLNNYHSKEWVNNPGYGIIKSDINWLINNIGEGGESE